MGSNISSEQVVPDIPDYPIDNKRTSLFTVYPQMCPLCGRQPDITTNDGNRYIDCYQCKIYHLDVRDYYEKDDYGGLKLKTEPDNDFIYNISSMKFRYPYHVYDCCGCKLEKMPVLVYLDIEGQTNCIKCHRIVKYTSSTVL